MPVDITRDDVQRLVREGAQVVDVRPEQEFGDEHIMGAIYIPLKMLDATIASGALEQSRLVIVY